LIILFFLLIGIVILARFVLPKNKIAAAWWNDGWNYRKAISISNSSGNPLSDFQVSLAIGTSQLIVEGKMQTDCGDIRITDISGNLLPIWIEAGSCNSSSTNILSNKNTIEILSQISSLTTTSDQSLNIKIYDENGVKNFFCPIF
jgi:hypothetical protein